MRPNRLASVAFSVIAIGALSGCTNKTTTRSPDEIDNVVAGLNQAGLKSVNVTQDRNKGVVVLSGNTQSEADKAQAESIAKSIVGGQVISDQIAVLPPGQEDTAKKVNSDIDEGIEHNVDAVLVKNKLKSDVKIDVKNGVVTLEGSVNSEPKRTMAEKLAAAVPNVNQVVNEIEVKNRRATTTE